MIVTKAKYCKDDNGNNISVNATIDRKDWSVPMVEDNTHYSAILAWVADGNTIEEAD
tara:strand:+ start:1079 stop:1249 length:171 start_codon:yes stop_codon:yes gene_type:complete